MSKARRDRENTGGGGPPAGWPLPPSSSFVPGMMAGAEKVMDGVFAEAT